MEIEQRVRISLHQAQYEGSYSRDHKEKGKLSNATHDRWSPSQPFFYYLEGCVTNVPSKGKALRTTSFPGPFRQYGLSLFAVSLNFFR